MHLFGARHWTQAARAGATEAVMGRHKWQQRGAEKERELIKTRLYPCLRLEMSWAAARVTQVRVLFSIITSDASLCFGSDGLFRMITLEISHRFIF